MPGQRPTHPGRASKAHIAKEFQPILAGGGGYAPLGPVEMRDGPEPVAGLHIVWKEGPGDDIRCWVVRMPLKVKANPIVLYRGDDPLELFLRHEILQASGPVVLQCLDDRGERGVTARPAWIGALGPCLRRQAGMISMPVFRARSSARSLPEG